MVEIKRDRPKMFDMEDLNIENITPASPVRRDDDEGVENFKKWFKDMKK